MGCRKVGIINVHHNTKLYRYVVIIIIFMHCWSPLSNSPTLHPTCVPLRPSTLTALPLARSPTPFPPLRPAAREHARARNYLLVGTGLPSHISEFGDGSGGGQEGRGSGGSGGQEEGRDGSLRLPSHISAFGEGLSSEEGRLATQEGRARPRRAVGGGATNGGGWAGPWDSVWLLQPRALTPSCCCYSLGPQHPAVAATAKDHRP